MSNRLLVRGFIATTKAWVGPGNPPGTGWIRDPKSGLYVRRSRNKNMIVLAGLSMLAKSIQYGHADAGKTIRYLEVGSGLTTPAKSDTALVTAVERLEIDSWDNTDIASDPVVMIASVLFDTDEGNGNLAECGLFVNDSGAPMFSRGLFGIGSISGATQADPVVITCVAHGLTSGDMVYIEGVAGMTELNGNAYYIDKLTDDTFALYSDAALSTSVDGSGFGAYSEGSPDADYWKKVIPKTTSETLTVTYSLTFPVE